MIKKMSRKSMIVVVTLITFFALSVTAFAAGRWVQAWQDDTLKIKFNGEVQTFTDPDDGSKIVPLVYNGRTYLPVRAIGGLAGLGVDYDSITRSVLLTSDGAAPVINDEPGDTPYKDAESFNSVFKEGVQDLDVNGVGKYTKTGTGTRKILTDDFESLTQYGFDVDEVLAYGANDKHRIAITIDLGSFSKEDAVRANLYYGLIESAKENGWVVKNTTSKEIYLYKDGVNLKITNGLIQLVLEADTIGTTTVPPVVKPPVTPPVIDNTNTNTGTTSSNAGTINDPVKFGTSFSWADESKSTSYGFRSNVTMSVTNVKKLTSADITAMGFKPDSDDRLEYVLVSLNIKGKNVTPTTIDESYIYYSLTQPEIWGSETSTGKYVIGGTDYGFDGSIGRNMDNIRYPYGTTNKINKGSSASLIDYSGNVILPIIKGETNYLVMEKSNGDLDNDARKIYFKLN